MVHIAGIVEYANPVELLMHRLQHALDKTGPCGVSHQECYILRPVASLGVEYMLKETLETSTEGMLHCIVFGRAFNVAAADSI